MSINLDTGAVSVVDEEAGPQRRTIGADGLSDIFHDETRYIGMVSKGRVKWEAPQDKLLGESYSTDAGWAFDHRLDVHAYIGTVGYVSADKRRLPGKHSLLVSIDDETGQRNWARTGLSPLCLPQVMSGQAAACEFGADTQIIDDDPAPIYVHAAASLVGFDPETGAATWTIPLKSPNGQTDGDWRQTFRPVGEQSLLIDGLDGPVVVDLTTGDAGPLGAQNAWCASNAVATLNVTLVAMSDGRPNYDRATDTSSPLTVKV